MKLRVVAGPHPPTPFSLGGRRGASPFLLSEIAVLPSPARRGAGGEDPNLFRLLLPVLFDVFLQKQCKCLFLGCGKNSHTVCGTPAEHTLQAQGSVLAFCRQGELCDTLIIFERCTFDESFLLQSSDDLRDVALVTAHLLAERGHGNRAFDELEEDCGLTMTDLKV